MAKGTNVKLMDGRFSAMPVSNRRSGVHRLIVQAVRECRTLTFWYDGEPTIVEPHWYGVDTKGFETLGAYQIGRKVWRLFHVHEISRLALGLDSFRPQSNFKRDDKDMTLIYAEV